jgi:hypothetical protein
METLLRLSKGKELLFKMMPADTLKTLFIIPKVGVTVRRVSTHGGSHTPSLNWLIFIGFAERCLNRIK